MKLIVKNYLGLLLCTVLLKSSLCAYHDEKYWQHNVGLLFNFARYELGNLHDIEGYLAGLHWDLSHQSACGLYMNLQFDGHWNAGPLCSDDECNDVDLKARVRDFRPELDLGYTFATCEERLFFTPYIGFGFFYLENKLKPQNVEYKYFNINVPIGAQVLWNVSDCFDLGLGVTYRIDAWTRLKLDIPNLIGENDCNVVSSNNTCGNNDDDSDRIELDRTHGVHVELPMIWKIRQGSCVDIQAKVVPFFDWNEFGEADECTPNNLPIEVPELKQWYLGLHVNIGISF